MIPIFIPTLLDTNGFDPSRKKAGVKRRIFHREAPAGVRVSFAMFSRWLNVDHPPFRADHARNRLPYPIVQQEPGTDQDVKGALRKRLFVEIEGAG